MKKVLLFTIFLYFSMVFAQSAQSVSVILTAKTARWEHVTYLAEAQRGTVPDVESPSVFLDSFEDCKNSGAFSKNAEPKADLTFANAAGFLMRYYNVSGGFLYAMGKSDHYAFRFLKNQGLIGYETEPTEKISGRNLINLMGDFSTFFLTAEALAIPALPR